MKKVLAFVLSAIILVPAALGASAPGPDQRRRPPRRTVVVVHKGFPLKRAPRSVVVRPLRRPFRVLPGRFLPAVFWTGVVVASLPARDVLVWEDGDTLSRDEEWTEVGLSCESSGTRVWLEVAAGTARFDWAEVVFENGDAQVVDMKEWERGPGIYDLLNWAGVRRVDHVRLVARSVTPEARIVLRLEK